MCILSFLLSLQSIKIGIKGIKMIMGKKALLMILDGWGLGKHGKGDVIYNTPTPYLDYLNAVLVYCK